MCLWIAFEHSCALQQNVTQSVALRTELCAVKKNKQPMRFLNAYGYAQVRSNSSLISTNLQQCIFLKYRIIFGW